MTERAFLIDFQQRRRDVRRYLAVLVKTEEMLLLSGRGAKHDRELRMFRAGALLVLYNAVEASARSAIQAIYDEVESTRTSFDDLRASFRRRIIKDFKANFGIDRYDELRQVAFHLVAASFDPSGLFSGNVDARKIREQAEEFGFSVITTHARTGNGADLLVIKNKRNDLAHGLVSFSEVGRQYVASDIRRIGRLSMNYMQDVLLEVEGYLDEARYRAVNA